MPSIHDQIIQNSNMTAATKAAQNELNAKAKNSSIGSDEFLFLLTQQLQYQDPMNPMDNTDMLAQEAQFATLEQMEGLADSFSKFSNMYQANSLLGQTVGVNVDGKEVIGKVDYADYSDASGASVSINGTMYPLDSITKIYPKDTPSIPSDKEENNKTEPNNDEVGLVDKAKNLISTGAKKAPMAMFAYEKANDFIKSKI